MENFNSSNVVDLSQLKTIRFSWLKAAIFFAGFIALRSIASTIVAFVSESDKITVFDTLPYLAMGLFLLAFTTYFSVLNPKLRALSMIFCVVEFVWAIMIFIFALSDVDLSDVMAVLVISEIIDLGLWVLLSLRLIKTTDPVGGLRPFGFCLLIGGVLSMVAPVFYLVFLIPALKLVHKAEIVAIKTKKI